MNKAFHRKRNSKQRICPECFSYYSGDGHYHPEFGFICNDCYKYYLNIYGNTSVYKFLSFEWFYDLVSKKRLSFTKPSAWSDSFEDFYFQKLIESIKYDMFDEISLHECLSQRDEYYCQSWTLTQESQQFWDEYGHNNTAIRIEMKLKDLFLMGLFPVSVKYKYINKKYLNVIIGEPEQAYIRSIVYGYEETALTQCESKAKRTQVPSRIIPSCRLKVSTIKDFEQFSFENEVRVFKSIKNFPNRAELEDIHDAYFNRVLQIHNCESEYEPFDEKILQYNRTKKSRFRRKIDNLKGI
ncbi:MAG: hypothetical protein HFJ21_03550 [Clostridia bacterium]|nr:hypothetical protein [Clostridia bacterium]